MGFGGQVLHVWMSSPPVTPQIIWDIDRHVNYQLISCFQLVSLRIEQIYNFLNNSKSFKDVSKEIKDYKGKRIL